MSNFSFSRSGDNVVVTYSKQAAAIGVSHGLAGEATMYPGTTATVPNSTFTNNSSYMIGAYPANDAKSAPIETDWYITDPNGKVTIPGAPAGGSLVDQCVASFQLTDPPAGFEGAKDIFARWLAFLDAAFPTGGVTVANNRLADATLKKKLTTCSQTLSNCFVNFGIPNKYYAAAGPSSIVPYKGQSKYEHAVAPGTLPRVGDPYIIGPDAAIKDTHHALFGPLVTQSPAVVLAYAGGQSSPNNYTASTIDAKRYNTALNPQGTTGILIGDRALLFYVDMWAFFNDHGSEVGATRKMSLAQ